MELWNYIDSFLDSRRGTMIVDGEKLPMRLVDLPCVVETHKTADRVAYFKTGDVGQAIIVGLSSKREQKTLQGHRMVSGITPPTFEIQKRVWSDKEIVHFHFLFIFLVYFFMLISLCLCEL